MKILRTLLLSGLLLATLSGCEKENTNNPVIPLAEQLAGEWLVVYQMNKNTDFIFQDHSEGVVTAWGCFYIQRLKINRDGSFTINNSHLPAPDSSHAPMGGHWKLSSQQQQITFDCHNADSIKHTVTFRIATDAAGYLILDNNQLLLKHLKKP